MEVPPYWKKFRDENGLADTAIEIPEDDDRSGLGAEIDIYCDDAISDEATRFQPGTEAVKHGYLPIGGCAMGSGDPYFIRIKDGETGALYRISHDLVDDDEFPEAKAVAVVLKRYTELLKFREDPEDD